MNFLFSPSVKYLVHLTDFQELTGLFRAFGGIFLHPLQLRHGLQEHFCVVAAGVENHLVFASVFLDDTVSHHGDVIGQIGGDTHVVGHDDDGSLVDLGQSLQLVDHLSLHGDIQGAGGLICQQKSWALGHSHGDGNSLLHSAGQLEGIGIQDPFRVVQMQPCQPGMGQLFRLLHRDILVGEGVFHELFPHRLDRVHGLSRILEDHGNVMAPELLKFLW